MPTPKPPTDLPAIRVVMMPRDTNAEGTIFGGVILSHIDQAAFVEARRQARHRFVTVCMREVIFKEPVFNGDVLSLIAETVRVGNTSITVRVQVFAERRGAPEDSVHVTEAEVVMVAVDDNCRPTKIILSS